MCDGPDTGGMGPGGAGGVANGGGSANFSEDFSTTAGNFIKNNLPGLLGGSIVGAMAYGMGKIPDHMKSPAGPLDDSKQGSTAQIVGADSSTQRTVLTQAAAKASDQRRATRSRTVLTIPTIRRPTLTKKETLGSQGKLGG